MSSINCTRLTIHLKPSTVLSSIQPRRLTGGLLGSQELHICQGHGVSLVCGQLFSPQLEGPQPQTRPSDAWSTRAHARCFAVRDRVNSGPSRRTPLEPSSRGDPRRQALPSGLVMVLRRRQARPGLGGWCKAGAQSFFSTATAKLPGKLKPQSPTACATTNSKRNVAGCGVALKECSCPVQPLFITLWQ